MKDLVIIGAGDFGREVSWVVERINQNKKTWNLLGFVDDNPSIQNEDIDGYSVLGTLSYFNKNSKEIYVVCSIGTGAIRKKVMDRVSAIPGVFLATLIDPAAIIGRNVKIGAGCVVCAGSILAISTILHDNVIINLNCTIGHDTILNEFCTVHPGSNISGKVQLQSCVDVGTGTKIIQGITVCNFCVLGAGTVVVKDIREPGTYVGIPAKLLTKR